MNEIAKLIEALKDLSKGSLLIIVFSVILILLVYNFSSYAPHVESIIKTIYEYRSVDGVITDIIREEREIISPDNDHYESYYNPSQFESQDFSKDDSENKSKFIVTIDDMDISEKNLMIIKEYADESFSLVYSLSNQLPAYLTVYKFIPEGDDRYFQGRVLVSDHTNIKTNLDLLLKEAGLVWMPMWVNKGTLERIIVDESFLSKLVVSPDKKGVYLEDDVETRGRVNMSIVYDMGVRWYYFYPISKGDYPVGYLVWALFGKPDEHELNHIHSKSVVLATRIYGYLLNDKL